MKKIIIVMATFSYIFLLSGCGQSVPNPLNEKECETLQKKIYQTDQFIENVSAMDPAHVDEVIAAIPRAEITTALTKSKMLKDAKKRKVRLKSLQISSGCHSE